MRICFKIILTAIAVLFLQCSAVSVAAKQSEKPIKIEVIKDIIVQTNNAFRVSVHTNPVTKVVFYSKNKDVATVNSKGVIRGVKRGDAIIGVKAYGTDEYRTTYKFIKVHVIRKIQNLQINLLPTTVYTNQTIALNPKAKTTILYKTSNPNVATVKNGKIYTKNPGSVTITIKAKATKKYENRTKTLHLTVIKKSSSHSAARIRNVDKLAPKAPKILRKFIKEMKYTIIIDPSIRKYQGYTNNRNRTIELKTTEERVIYHELGHVLAFISGNADMLKNWKTIYKEEKNKYTGDNQPYAKSNAQEFFAECFKDYILHPNQLKTTCPKSYKYIKKNIAELSKPALLPKMQIIANLLCQQ